MLEDELLPNTRAEMNFEIESDGNLIWQAGAERRVVITRMQLYVPRIAFNSEGRTKWANILNRTSGLIWEKILKDQIAAGRELDISEFQLVFQNLNMFLYL